MAEVNDNNSIQLFENQKIRTAWDAAELPEQSTEKKDKD